MEFVVAGMPPCLSPILVDVISKQERLLAFGRLMQQLPKMKPEERKIVQQWLRARIQPAYLELAQRFVAAPPSFILRTLVEETPLETINEKV